MSDFPELGNYNSNFSNSHIRRLDKTGFKKDIRIVIKREKDQFIYDIDENKYVDFYLNNGTVIYGHNHKTITQFIKNGISTGTSSFFLNKFYSRLVKTFEEIVSFDSIAFFNSLENGLLSLFNFIKPELTGVNTSFLLDYLKNLFPEKKIELAAKTKKYSLIIFEPIDFDGDISLFSFDNYKADSTCSFESRAAFRLKYGFLKNLKEADFIISSNNIANGLDCAVILSKTYLEGENIPIFKTLAINETLKFFRRKIDYDNFKIRTGIKAFSFINKSIFRLKEPVNPADCLPNGIFLNGNTGFISCLHTEFDFRRLERIFLPSD